MYRRSRRLGAIPVKHTVFNQYGLSVESLMLSRNSCTARAAEIINDFNSVDGWIGTAKDLDGAAVGKEKPVLGNCPVRFHGRGELPRDKIICARNTKTS